MLKALVTSGAYATGNIPLTLDQNTNNKYQLNSDNTISIKISGLTEIKGNIVVTATAATPLSCQLYADGTAVPGAIDTQTVDTIGDIHTFHINDIVKTVLQNVQSYATLSIRMSGACTLTGGDVIATYER